MKKGVNLSELSRISKPQRQLGDFLGHWHLKREISDDLGGHNAKLEGRAWFSQAKVGLIYREEGQLSIENATSLNASQTYLWRETDQDFQVLFSDERAFHYFSRDADQPEASHFCPPDIYDVSYDFRDFDAWMSTWYVKGPRKHYRMKSVYTKNRQ